MTQFCTCGSIIINEQCTNKNCSTRSKSKQASPKKAAAKSSSSVKKEPKSPRTRRSSKCVTYNLYDVEKEENAN